MDMTNARQRVVAWAALFVAAGLVFAPAAAQDRKADPALAALVPRLEGWKEDGAPRSFFPETLYEYIDGAAENYLSYDFRQLFVVDLKKEGTEAALTVEVYDMGLPGNAFGIFGAERYPENAPVAVGDLGYLEGESLNFVAGRYYVKLLSYGLKEATAPTLTDFGQKLAAAAPGKGGLPPLLAAFPKEGLVARSERYVRKNFLGYEFLHDGYTAAYTINGQEVEAFLVAAGAEKEAEDMLHRLLESLAKDKELPEKIAAGYHIKDRYAQNMYIGVAGAKRNMLCGVRRVPAAAAADGERLFKALIEAAAGPGR